MRKTILAGGIAAATLIAGITVSGCGTASEPTQSSPTPTSAQQSHNQADIDFAQGMIPHHAQAVSMAKLAAERASSPQVKDLAGAIEGAQQPEIDQMTGFLRAWNAPAPQMGNPTAGGMNHNSGGSGQMQHGSMPGMMSADQMAELEQASGAEFDRAFLQMMIAHHRGAIEMSNTELSNGQNPEAKQLAQRIIDAQQREITEMNQQLNGG